MLLVWPIKKHYLSLSSWTQFAQKYLQLGMNKAWSVNVCLGNDSAAETRLALAAQTPCAPNNTNYQCLHQHQNIFHAIVWPFAFRVWVIWVEIHTRVFQVAWLLSVLLVVLVVVMMVAVWVGIVGRFWWVGVGGLVGTVGQGPFVNWARKLPWVERFCPCGCLFSGTQCLLKRELWALR